MLGGFGAFFHPPEPEGPFERMYRCYSVSFANKADKENGDKIILPQSAFEQLARMMVTYPMQFELRNESLDDIPHTHVGVLEFTAPEGQCFVPHWIMSNLVLEEGSYVTVRNVSLPLATFVKFRPRSTDFLDISNPKAVLENTLRNFSCLTLNDQICFAYNGRNYYVDIVELKPAEAASIVEADIEVDFAPPIGYVEPARKPATPALTPAFAPSPFPGTGSSLTGSGLVDLTGEDGAPFSLGGGVGSLAKSPPAGLVAGSPGLGPSSAGGVAGSLGSTSSLLAGGGGAAGAGAGAGASGTDASASAMAELAKAREERRRQLAQSKSAYVAFSGSGRRVDGKTAPSGSPASTPSASPALGPVGAGAGAGTGGGFGAPPLAPPRSVGSSPALGPYSSSSSSLPVRTASASSNPEIVSNTGKWKQKTQGALFLGEGRKLG